MTKGNSKEESFMKNLGIMTAVISPMFADGVTVNEKALTAIIEDQIQKGVGSLLLLGGTGENTAVPREARKKILDIGVKAIAHRVPVIAGVVELGVYEAIDSAKTAKEAGADMILVAPPFGRATTVQGCIDFFKAIDTAVDMPILIYNFPGRFGDNGYGTSPDVVGALIDAVPNVIGIKECSCKLEQTVELIGRFGDKIQVLSGNEYLAAWEMLAGAKGAILASSNVLPGEWVEIYNAAMAHDAVKVTQLGYRYQNLQRILFKSQNPGPSKYAMTLQGFEAGLPLMPCAEAPESVKAEVRAEMKRLNLI